MRLFWNELWVVNVAKRLLHAHNNNLNALTENMLRQRFSERMNGWTKMDEWMNENGWTDERKRMNGWTDERLRRWMDERMNGWGDERMNGWMVEAEGWMNGWTEGTLRA